MSGECKLQEAQGNNSTSPSMGEGQQQSLCFMSHMLPARSCSLNFQFTTTHNSLQQPNFIFYTQILSHIILYIALGPNLSFLLLGRRKERLHD